MISNGLISLKREILDFKLGFCIINLPLKELEKKTPLFLHEKEIAYYNTLTYPKRKHSYLIGRTASKTAINELLNPKKEENSFYIDFSVFQFPVIKNLFHSIQVSISHCGNIGIAIAFEETHPIGIDIEALDIHKILAIKKHTSVAEQNLIEANALPEVVGQTLLWTSKESLSKVLKTGLMIDLSVLEIKTLKQDGVFYISTFKNFNQYKAISIVSKDYVCSLVMPKNTTAYLDDFAMSFNKTTQENNYGN